MSSPPPLTPESSQPAQDAGIQVEISEDMRQQVSDALLLLEHGVQTGFKTAAGETIPMVIMTAIKSTVGIVGTNPLHAQSFAEGSEKQAHAGRVIAVGQWVSFEVAYHDLAALMSPITAQTLRNTEGTRLTESPAQRFALWLWVVAIAYALVVIAGEWGLLLFGPGEEGVIDAANTVMQLSQVLTPYAFGGLGACVYLLRSAHQFIHERTFDLRRKQEYFNRILLGSIGGGAIILFINEGLSTEGEPIRLSAAALGFLAGYSTDFLFNTIERVIGAILPKVGLETIRRAPVVASRPALTLPPGLTVKDMLDRYQAAQGEDKIFLRSLIESSFRTGGS